MSDLIQTVSRALNADAQVRQDLRIAALEEESDGAIVIEGVARSLAAKKRTLAIAARAGAHAIADRIRIDPGVTATDAEIRQALAERFAAEPAFADLAIFEDLDPSPLAERLLPVASPAAPAGRIEIEVRDGVVTLSGQTPTLVRKRLAGTMAWWTVGVRDVINGLGVEPPEDDSADQLEEAVRTALERDPFLDDRQIRVGVRDGVVRLTGLLRTDDARRLAERDAWSVLGVEDVIDEIDVVA